MRPAPIYVYLCYGPSPQTAMELRYSVETLLPEISGDLSRVAVFTDRPARFADLPATVVDISADLPGMTGADGYAHRAKPVVLARAIRHFGRDCAMLDTDSFIRPGFDARVVAALDAGAAMNQFVRARAYPDLGPFATVLPHLGSYVFDAQHAPMFNSGLCALRLEHADLLDDAVVLLDRLWAAGFTRHDLEQFATSECLRLAGVPIALIEREFEHYCPRWSKRYMRRRLRARGPSGAPVPYSKLRVRLFKGERLLRVALRRIRR